MPDPERSNRKAGSFWSFWSTLPGILTGVAAVIGSIAAVLALFAGGGNGPAGDNAARVTVPDVVGRSEEAATGLLQGRELDVSRVTPRCGVERRGTVVDQQPRPGTKLERDAAVSLTVASGQRLGEITSPRSGRRDLPDTYIVRVKLCAIPNASHVWIATRTNGSYPEEELEPDSAGRDTFTKVWETELREFGEKGFSHLLLLVGASGERAIEQWKNTKQEAPPNSIPGMEVLDTVNVALRPAR